MSTPRAILTHRRGRRAPAPGLVTLVCCLLAAACGSARSPYLYDRQSEYNRVIVQETPDGVRSLVFGEHGGVQTSIDMKDPTRLVHPYVRAIMCGLAVVPRPTRMLIVGLGGAVMPTFLRRNYPDAVIDVAELDPEVKTVAVRFFGFKEDARMRVHIGDGRAFIEQARDRYDVIFLDAYGPDSIPYMLVTKEFLVAVRSRLADGGIVLSNVWGSDSNTLYASMVRTYEAVFEEVHVVRAPASDSRILIALPTRAGLGKQALIDRTREIEGRLVPRIDLSQIVDAGYQEPDPALGGTVLLDRDAPR